MRRPLSWLVREGGELEGVPRGFAVAWYHAHRPVGVCLPRAARGLVDPETAGEPVP